MRSRPRLLPSLERLRFSRGFGLAGFARLAERRGGARGPVSPEVGADRTLTLRYLAAGATQVTASGELDGKPHPMTKGADGIWSVTVGPLAPDIYTYAFNVDGVVALDPRNVNTKFGYGNFGAVSIVEVPGETPAFYDVKDVPHGEVRIKPYVSKALGLNRTAHGPEPIPLRRLAHDLSSFQSRLSSAVRRRRD